MKTFRYDTSQQWIKGNTHLHSTASDGKKTFAELDELYADAGYDFMFRTDHWVASDTSADRDPYRLLWMDGVEFDGKDENGSWFHVVALGQIAAVSRETGFVKAMLEAREQGALLVLAHPHWCGNSLDDALRWPFRGAEIYNHVCHWLNGKSNGLVHWDAMLRKDPDTLAFAVDDAHLGPNEPWKGGWIVVNAPERTAEAIMAAIRSGNFYSSMGPAFESISIFDDELVLETSPVRFARLVGPGAAGKRVGSIEGPLLTSARLTIPADWRYAYVELEDENGKRAWTNNLFYGGTPDAH